MATPQQMLGPGLHMNGVCNRRQRRAHRRSSWAWLAAALLATTPAAAGELWLHTGGVSKHESSNPRDETNPGLGLEYRLDGRWAVSAGTFHNSFSRQSTYALVNWTPLQRGRFRFGLTGGAVTGYQKKKLGLHGQAIPVVLPTMDLTAGRFSMALIAAPPLGDASHGSVMALFKVAIER